MKKIKFILTTLLVLGCTIVPIAALYIYEDYRNADLTAEILARAPEKGNFTPNKITVKVGQKVKLSIRNTDTVTHGFAIPAFDIDIGSVKAGHVAIVEFQPKEAGTYDFYCTEWCSEHHLQMRGVIEVVKK